MPEVIGLVPGFTQDVMIKFAPVLHGMALCAGAGGLELGLRIALGDGYRCVVYVEREAYAAATLVARMADEALDTAPVWDDVVTFDGRPWRGSVDLVSAGFSCQPWSVAGKQLGVEDERWIWPDLARIIREVGPEWVFLENVPGLVRGGLEHVLGDLAESGFDAEWDVLSAAEVGATQLRERLYILAHSHRERRSVERIFRVLDGEWATQRDDANGCHTDVGHTDGSRLEGRQRPIERCPNEWTAWKTSTTVADPTRVQRQAEQRSAAHGDVGYFPPRPDDLQSWERMPAILEPALCRMAYGVAGRVDRLRLTGNGVVPLAAAVAFLRLRDRLT